MCIKINILLPVLFWTKYSENYYMFVWTSGFQNPLVHTDFNMFVDE